MDATTSPQRTSNLPAPPPRPPRPEDRTDRAAGNGPGWLPVAATVVAQAVWLVFLFYAWIITIVVIGYSGGVLGTGPDHVGVWIVLASIASAALAPVPSIVAVRAMAKRRSLA